VNFSTLKGSKVIEWPNLKKLPIIIILEAMESDNCSTIYRDDKVRIRNRADYRMYNYNMNIREGKYNFRRGLVLGRGCDLHTFCAVDIGLYLSSFHFLTKGLST
jgi:hypothetical protein